MTTYTVPKEDRMFWGAEFMNANGVIIKSIAQYRLELHIKQNGLKTERGFNTDEELCQILKTDKSHLTMDEALSLLGFDSTPSESSVSNILAIKEVSNVGQSWKTSNHEETHWATTCQNCGYVMNE